MRQTDTVLRVGWRDAYRVLVGKPEGKITLGGPEGCRREDNIKVGL
jgi:hypothetical protein